MKVLIAGGSGYLGRHLARTFLQDNHEVSILTRGAEGVAGTKLIPWDGRSIQGWGQTIEEMDLVIHLAGKSLGTWPWTKARKQEFETSRVESGRVLLRQFSRPGIVPACLCSSQESITTDYEVIRRTNLRKLQVTSSPN